MSKTTIKAIRYHDISTGHRVVGHEGKCRHLHGHNYRIYFYCESEMLDHIGRVVDFSVIKSHLCQWLEDNWDHRFLAWHKDLLISQAIVSLGSDFRTLEQRDEFSESIVFVPFNPTAENMAHYLLTHIAPELMAGTGVVVTKVVIEETRKCSVEVAL